MIGGQTPELEMISGQGFMQHGFLVMSLTSPVMFSNSLDTKQDVQAQMARGWKFEI